MNKIKRRTMIVLALAALVALAAVIIIIRFLSDGSDWAGAYFNSHAYQQGIFVAGEVQDRNGATLLYTRDGARQWNDSETLRRATLHAVGDADGNIGGSAQNQFRRQLMGYNAWNGLWSLSGQGRRIRLTIDAELCAVAYEALAGRQGCVMLYNYKNGEILCLVSSPGFDPANAPDLSQGGSGQYIDRAISASFPPGSIFKLVTLMAALENIPDIESRTFVCDSSYEIGGDTVTCTESHGEQGLAAAFANSCNSAFAELSLELGPQLLAEYAASSGVSGSLEINGYTTAGGNFDLAEQDIDIAWSGIGQYHDLVTPAAMLHLVGAIANGGAAKTPRLLKSVATNKGLPLWIDLLPSSDRLLDSDTAARIAELMANNVTENYGADNFPGLSLAAKSGTAEVDGAAPHAWFTGFLNDSRHPYAFIVLVENGGSGATMAGSVANKLLQAAVGERQ